MTIAASPATDAQRITSILEQISRDLGALLGHEFALQGPRVTRAATRPAGDGQVHISFRLAFVAGELRRHGTLLVPLPEALTMAGYLLMIPDESVVAHREDCAPDAAHKDALLEIGNMLGVAVNTALAGLGLAAWSVHAEGCQGVRPGIRPAFPYEEGSELVVARVQACLEPHPTFELILVLPVLA